MKKSYLLLLVILFVNMGIIFSQNSIHPQTDAQSLMQKADKRFFIENKGQWDSDVLYLCRMGGLDAWITKYGVNYTFYKIQRNPNASKNNNGAFHPHDKFNREGDVLLGHRVLFELQGYNPNPTKEGKQKQSGYYNYLIGNDVSKHASNVGMFEEVIIKDVYQGIDIRYYFDKGFLRFDFIVQPFADIQQIKIKLKGQFDEKLKDNELIFSTRFGKVSIAELLTLQEGKPVASKFISNNNIYKIQMNSYDISKPLIIDPIIYSTFIGGSSDDNLNDMDIDENGNVFIIGTTNSADYSTTSGVFQSTINLDTDVFVSKLDSLGTYLVYSTFIGGNNFDYGNGIKVDELGSVYITGNTFSNNFSITAGAFQSTLAGNADVFVTKINATGTALLYSTYIGGGAQDVGQAIAIDNSGCAYVTGFTFSTNYKITAGTFQTTNGGGVDVFVTKVNATGTGLVYSTYIGGSNEERGQDIVIDNAGFAFITGFTSSSNYDITTGSFQTTFGGGAWDVFVTKLNATGSNLSYSTFLGGTGNEFGYSIALDNSENAYITGNSGSLNFPITTGAFQTINDGGFDAFVTKLNTSGSNLIYSTLIGGNGNDIARSIVVDSNDNAIITGHTGSTNFDITPGAIQTIMDVGNDLFVTKLNNLGTNIIYSTYLGGNNNDEAFDIKIDMFENVYVAGTTTSTSGNIQTSVGTGKDVYIVKLCLGEAYIVSTQSIEPTVCPNTQIPTIVHVTEGATGIGSPLGLPAGVVATWINDTISISGTPTVSGIYNYSIPLIGGCGSNLSAEGLIYVNNLNSVSNASLIPVSCENITIPEITHITTGATGIGTPSGLPPGINATWINDTIKINGLSNVSGVYKYSIPLIGGCGNVNATGTITINNCATGINLNNDNIDLLIYPNPATTQFTIANAEIGTRVSVIDITGKVLLSEKVNANTQVISTKDLVNGIYFVQIENNGQISQKKLVVNK